MTGGPHCAKRKAVDLFGIKLWPERSIEDEEFPEQRRHRWLLIWAVVALLVAAVLLRPVIYPIYRHLRAEQFVAKAKEQIAVGDAAGARASLERGLHYEPSRPDLATALADALRAEGSPRYATMLLRAAAVETNRPELVISSLEACVKENAVDLVVPLIDRFTSAHGDQARLWYWIGHALAKEARRSEAESAWSKAAALAPRDSRIQLDVAKQEILSPKPEVVARGYGRLDALLADADRQVRFEATEALANAVGASDPRKASAFWERYVVENPDDRRASIAQLLYLAKVDPDAGGRRIGTLWSSATNVDQRLELASELSRIDGPQVGLNLIDLLPPADKANPKALVTKVDLLGKASRWKELVDVAEASTESRSRYSVDDQIAIWGWLAFARHGLADISAFQAAIRALEALVGTSADRAMRVGNWLASRGFDFEAAGFFRNASRPNSPRRYQALEALNALYTRTGDRQKRLQTCEQLLQLDADNPVVQSELASVLLELGWDRARALKLAKDAFERNRASYEFMDAYARALAMNNLATDGVAMYEQMPPEVLARDMIRLNYVESLMAAGRFADARLQLIKIRPENLPRAVQPRRDRLEIELRAR